jgi:heme/copper-type cytochrome/quinol oxidase subunit 2
MTHRPYFLWLGTCIAGLTSANAQANGFEESLIMNTILSMPHMMLMALIAILAISILALGRLVYRRRSQETATNNHFYRFTTIAVSGSIITAVIAVAVWQPLVIQQIHQLPATAASSSQAPDEVPGLVNLFNPADKSFAGQIPVDKQGQAASERGRHAGVNFAALEQTAFTLNLFDDLEVVAVRDRISQDSHGGYTWIGRIDGEPDSQVILSARGNTLAGMVTVYGRSFEVVYANGQTHTVRELDLDNLPAEEPPEDAIDPAILNSDATSDKSAFTDKLAGDASTGQIVDLLVVYTAKARDTAGGDNSIKTQITAAVEAANQAYINSQIDITLRLVTDPLLTEYTETNVMTDAFYALWYTSDGSMDEVHTLRNTYGADIVVLINADNDYCGLAPMMTSVSTSFERNALGVVRQGCLSLNSLAHEIGHMMGNQHNPESASGPGAYPDSYGYRVCGSFRDIMSYQCRGEPRVLYFSNPSVTYNGQITGVLGTQDTARSMNATAATVASFRPAATTATTPAVPNGLEAMESDNNAVQVTWLDVDDEQSYQLESAMEGSAWMLIATLNENEVNHYDTDLLTGAEYAYRIRACNSVGCSDYSDPIFVLLAAESASSTAPESTTPAPAVDMEAPVLIIDGISDGDTVSGNVKLSVTATDNVGVTNLKLYLNRQLVGVSDSGSLSYNWNTRRSPNGTHTLSAEASDDANNLGTLTITVTK